MADFAVVHIHLFAFLHSLVQNHKANVYKILPHSFKSIPNFAFGGAVPFDHNLSAQNSYLRIWRPVQGRTVFLQLQLHFFLHDIRHTVISFNRK
jgi:hypothetical protein